MKLNFALFPAFLACITTMLLASTAQARPHGARTNDATERSGSYENRFGNGTFSQNVNRSPGSANGSTTWTNANGSQGSHTFNNTWDSSTGTGTHQSSTTLANGKTTSSQGTAAKTDNGYTYTGIATGPKGNTTDVSKTVTTSKGTRIADTTYTNPVTGKNSTVDRMTTYANGSKQISTTAASPNGKTAISNQDFTKSASGYSQTGTVTGPNGSVSTDNRNVSYIQNSDGTITRTMTGSVTGPHGNTTPIGNSETYNKSYTPNN